MGCHFFLQGIFPTMGSNPGFLHWRCILFWLSHKESPIWHKYINKLPIMLGRNLGLSLIWNKEAYLFRNKLRFLLSSVQKITEKLIHENMVSNSLFNDRNWKLFWWQQNTTKITCNTFATTDWIPTMCQAASLVNVLCLLSLSVRSKKGNFIILFKTGLTCLKTSYKYEHTQENWSFSLGLSLHCL